jgi:hypothetical protein
MTVKTMTNFFESNSGYFPTLSYRNCRPASQEINWRWLDSTGMRRRVIAEFNPPLRNEKVDFSRESRSYNLFTFNRRDRLDSGAPPAQADKERIAHFVGYRYKSLAIRINFPGAVPVKIWPEARKGPSALDPLERQETNRVTGAAKQLTNRTFELAVSQPRIGYSYHLVWSLPDDEEEQLVLSIDEVAMARELQGRLIQAEFGEGQSALRNKLTELRQKIETLFPSDGLCPSGDLNVALYVYRPGNEQGALFCLADMNASADRRGIKIGRTLVGRC